MISYDQSTGLPSSRRRRATTPQQAMKAKAKATPNVFIERPKMWISGFMVRRRGAFAAR